MVGSIKTLFILALALSCGAALSSDVKASGKNACPKSLAETRRIPSTVFESKGLRTRLRFYASTNPKAHSRPVFALIPGGPGLSHRTLLPLVKLAEDFDLVFIDPPGTGEEERLPIFHKDTVGSQYKGVVESIAGALFRDVVPNLNKRGLVLIGHSYGGIYAGEMLGEYGKDWLSSVVGFVALSSPLTAKSYQEMNNSRNELRQGETEFRESRNAVLDWGNMNGLSAMHILQNLQLSPTDPESYKDRHFQEQLHQADRDNYVRWALAYRDFLWGDKDAQIVRDLILGDRTTLSPDLVRRALKSWRHEKEGQTIVDKLRALPKVKKLMIAGGMDTLLSPGNLREDAQKMGGRYISIRDGSHFLFTSSLDELHDILFDEFANPTSWERIQRSAAKILRQR